MRGKELKISSKENLYILSRTESFIGNVIDVKSRALEIFENIYNQNELTRVCLKLKSFNVSSDKTIRYEELSKLVEKAKTLDKVLYTKNSWKLLQNNIEVAKAMNNMKNSSKLEFMKMENALKKSFEDLVEIKGKKTLKENLEKADYLEKSMNIKNIANKAILVENFVCAKTYARTVLDDMNVTDNFVDVANSLLENSIKELFIRKAI